MKMDNPQEAQNGHTVSKLPEKSKEKTAQRISNPQHPRLLPLKKAAEYLGIGYWAMRRLAWDRVIPVVQFPNGRKMYFDIADLEEVINRIKLTN
jgi:hypothetical protein